nr:hypothetical protein [Candidatus Sigynarchaeum springense]
MAPARSTTRAWHAFHSIALATLAIISFVQPARGEALHPRETTDGSILVSTSYEFQFGTANATNQFRFELLASCQAPGSTFSYVSGTVPSVHDYVDGKLANVHGLLNVTSCDVSETIETPGEYWAVLLINDGNQAGPLNVTYTITTYYSYVVDYGWLMNLPSNLFFAARIAAMLGIAVFVVWLCYLGFERRKAVGGEKHG